MILLAIAALSIASQAAEDVLPYMSIVSVSTVRATAAGAITCAVTTNGVAQESDCSVFAGAPAGLRQMHRDAELTMIFAITPEGRGAPPAPAAAGELIVEGRARLGLTQDGRVAHCDQIVQRVIRHVAGVRRPPDFCNLYPVGQRAFAAADGADPRSVEISAIVYLREGPPG